MVNKTSKHGKQIRKGITIQLVEGKDDDLIQVITELDDGERQGTLKKWLRDSQGFADMQDGKPPADHREALSYLTTDVGWLKEQMLALHPYLEEKFANVAMRPASFGTPPVEVPKQVGVSQETLDKRAERLKKRSW